MEHVTNCLNPRLIYNKYIKKEVFVECGKCEACLERRRSQWVARMMQEAKCWQFSYVLYLDYNDSNLPRFDFSEDGRFLTEACPRLSKDIEKFDLEQLDLKGYELQYVIERLNSHYTCIPHPCVRDIQLFKKRLNTYIKREVTGKYKNFRSCIASEIGPSTFRPHYHGILYFNDVRIAEKITELVSKAWRDDDGNSLGHASAEPPRSTNGSVAYVAKYCVKPADLPEIYAYPPFRPFFLTSRNPPIGSLLQSTTEIREIFFGASPQRVVFGDKQNAYTPKIVPIDKRIKNRLFPKCPLYSQISTDARIELYKSVIQDGIFDYNSYCFSLLRRCTNFVFDEEFHESVDYESLFSKYEPSRTILSRLIYECTQHYSCFNSLHTLYAASRRIVSQAEIFGISFDCYLKYIFKFYDENLPRYVLKRFYQKQDDLIRRYDENYMVFYPESPPPNTPDVSPVDSNEYQLYKIDVEQRVKDKNVIKYKNDYVESKLVRNDPVLFNIIQNYYGKKRIQNDQAFAHSRA